jgi:hypothetical protein
MRGDFPRQSVMDYTRRHVFFSGPRNDDTISDEEAMTFGSRHFCKTRSQCITGERISE